MTPEEQKAAFRARLEDVRDLPLSAHTKVLIMFVTDQSYDPDVLRDVWNDWIYEVWRF